MSSADEQFFTFSSRASLCRLLVNALKTELNPICYLLALLGAHHILHVSRIRVNLEYPLDLRQLLLHISKTGQSIQQHAGLSQAEVTY